MYWGKYSIFRALWALLKNGYLKEAGWFRSFCTHSSVDFNGIPIPWINYSMIRFLSSRITNDMSILEFGGGNSSMYWAEIAKEVITVEHDKEWASYIKDNFSRLDNVRLLIADKDSSYENAPLELEKKFQLIIIDGIRRIECLQNTLQMLTDDGCILLDDTQFPEFRKAFQIMKQNGFKELRISGAKPIFNDFSEATVFYRSSNILGI